jgi:MFS transporter, DHA2 family, multidrug resistance protein
MSPTTLPAPSAVPGLRRNMVTICAMTATIMQALDTTIANVALPYMQGSLSASQDQINWVLTSYIVAAAIMTAPVGWIANRFGRKRTFIVCSAGFTIASVLCGLAQDINQMVLFRLLQGVFGAALVPLSQAVMLDSYTLQERAKAMSIWGMGVMMGPIMGPSLGAWLTETYSWHWVFFVNLPFGIITVLGLVIFMDETKQDLDLRFDWFGFAALAIGIGSLQVALDRGEQLGWLESNEIIAEFIIAGIGFYYFLAHSFTTSKPFIQFALFKDRNFLGGCVFMTVMGLVLYSTMALSSPYLQNVIGYPIITAGVLLASRGCGTFVAMMLVGRMMRFFEARTLIITGLSLTALSLFAMTGWTDQTSASEIVVLSIIQGFGFGLVFVPLSTVAFLTLPGQLRTDGTSMLTLLRNVASSVGISIVIAQLTEGSRRIYAILSEHINPFNQAMQMPDVAGMINMNTDGGRAMADVMVALQAQIIAFSQDYQLVMIFILCSIPLAIMIGSTRAALRKQTAGPEHAVME